MRKSLCILAGLGFAFSLVIHLTSLMGIYDEEVYSYVWLMHGGVFFVFVPAIFQLRKNPNLKMKNQVDLYNIKEFLGAIFTGKPKAFKFLTIGFLFYAILNFFLFNRIQQTDTVVIDGKYVIQDDGGVEREITEMEYNKLNNGPFRGFSGHWMFFYFLSMVVLWPASKEPNLNPGKSST